MAIARDRKVYLGDGVYAQINRWANGGSELVLTTENGFAVTNQIVLEPQVYAGLVQFIDSTHKKED